MTATADDLTVVRFSHFVPTLLGRFAERDFGIVVVTIVAAFDSDESELEHNKNLKRESERTGGIITP
jgi:hypothetical protein